MTNQVESIKFAVFIPLCIVAIGVINYLFMQLLNWTIDKTSLWYQNMQLVYFIMLIPFFWGIIWAIFKLTAIGLAAMLIPVSPNKNFSLYSLGILSLINCTALIIYYWTRYSHYSWRVILMSIIITVFILDFSTSILIVFSKRGSRTYRSEDPDLSN